MIPKRKLKKLKLARLYCCFSFRVQRYSDFDNDFLISESKNYFKNQKPMFLFDIQKRNLKNQSRSHAELVSASALD